MIKMSDPISQLQKTPVKNNEFYVSWISAIFSGFSIGIYFIILPHTIKEILLYWPIFGMIIPFGIYCIGRGITIALEVTHFEYYSAYMGGYLGSCALGLILSLNNRNVTPIKWIAIIAIIIITFFLGLYIGSKIKRS